MSYPDKQLDGYKFSFRKTPPNHIETPKFVSIELPPSSFTASSNSLYTTNTHNKTKSSSKTKIKFYQQKLYTLTKSNNSQRSLIKCAQDTQTLKEIQQNKKRKAIQTMRPKTFYYENHDDDEKIESREHKIKTKKGDGPLRRSRSMRSSRESGEESYLQIYNKQKRDEKIFNKQRVNQTKITVKNETSILNFMDIYVQESPKSISSARDVRDHTKYGSNLISPVSKGLNSAAIDIINASLFPQITKSIRFLDRPNLKKKLFNNSQLDTLNKQYNNDVKNEEGKGVRNEDDGKGVKFPVPIKKLFKAKGKGKLNTNEKITDLAAKIQRMKAESQGF